VTATAAAAPTASSAAATTAFSSDAYGYTVAVPAGWQATAATAAWDGSAPAPTHEDAQADVLSRPDGATTAAISAATTMGLPAYAAAWIARTAAEHGDTCPGRPVAREQVSIGGEPGVLLAWNCGILINIAVAVHGGAGYAFVFRDPGVHAATDPADHDDFVRVLRSVRFKG
jgi:hypothetical protein